MKPIRLAVVDDSAFVRKAIVRMLRGERRIQVVGTAGSGEELLANLQEWKPDVITLDLSMPGIGGLVTLDRVMDIRPTPVIILSTHAGRGAPLTIEALHRGAVDFIDKQQYSLVDFPALQRVLMGKILAVTSPQSGIETTSEAAQEEPDLEPRAAAQEERSPRFEALLLGASTGGPPAIQQVLEDLGGDCPVPVLVVQHMPSGFTSAFADRLNMHLPLSVAEAHDGAALQRNRVLIAPAGCHLRVNRVGDELVAELSEEPADRVHRPSVDELFVSAARVLGSSAVAALLTGMGRDGAEGLRHLSQLGAHTVAQDKESSVVYGMPGAAADLKAARRILPLAAIGPHLRRVLARSTASSRS